MFRGTKAHPVKLRHGTGRHKGTKGQRYKVA